MTEPLLYRFFRWICDKTGHLVYHGWVYDGYYHRDCKICGRIVSKPIEEKNHG